MPISADKVPIKNKSHEKKILEYLKEFEKLTTREAQGLVGLSERGTRKIISKMVDEGSIVPEGANRNRKYKLP